MVDSPREQRLREEYHSQTARINWHDLQTYYAHGSVIWIGPGLNLVEVAVQLGMDNSAQFQLWIDAGELAMLLEGIDAKQIRRRKRYRGAPMSEVVSSSSVEQVSRAT